MDRPIHFEVYEEPRPAQPLEDVGLDAVNLLDVMSQFNPCGLWRLDIETGLAYWTRDVFEIHNLPYKPGPVDVMAAVDAYHPQDRELLLNCLEEAVARKTGFQYVLRLTTPSGGSKMVRAIGKYQVGENGREEVIGIVYETSGTVRGVAVRS
ncbi:MULTISPECIES: PAS domain-containing protein [unclassified Roseitalea]|uniref:PAS domain-containing protein n=1 Tax=unclassified Roseitalea TaxID=2639107 RepID=UPI00273DC300|nr:MULTISPECIES: PAS domain-containing protein [unclassified Roseitalea]